MNSLSTNPVSKPAEPQKPPVVTGQNPKLERMLAEEEFRLIQRLILFQEPAHRVFTFCPVEEGDGCSWVVSRLARALARNLTRSVCVVDADFRAPAQHRNFALNSPKGFAQLLVDSIPARSTAQQISNTNLWILPAGGAFADPYRLLLAERMHSRIEELRQEFDYVIIDTPAAAAHADVTLIAKWTDGIVLVAGSGSTRHQTALRVRESLQSAGAPLLGAVLNKRTYPIPDFIYERL
jgi:capsular exopolysaccharide synthesis family protein